NNWAVSGSKTASGYPILCNDPHLALTLPSIWYEMQLVSPEVNVYGVTLPGTPAVIIGFNQSIAWGVTNAGSDVLDWFEIKFKDAKQTEYFYDGAWRPTQHRTEEIKVRGAKNVRDTVAYTHHGPVPYREHEKPFNLETPAGAAMRWTAHDASQEMMTFLQVNRARNYAEYVAAISHYDCPAQNFVFADTAGDIAIWHNGKFPLRWPEQGKYIGDGSAPAYDWQGWIPREHVPHVKNPERSFVSSANQSATDLNYPYYLGSDYAAFERGARINEYLGAKSNLTPQDMMNLQNDIVSLFAQKVLPRLLEVFPVKKLNAEQMKLYETLAAWKYEYRSDFAAPLIFNTWWRELFELIWKDDMKIGETELKYPRRDVTMSLVLNEPANSFYDIKDTPAQESLADLTLQAFQSMQRKLVETHGAFGVSWNWEKSRGTDLAHLARMPGLGRIYLPTAGNGDNVNAITKTHGPSWRMIVALGPEVKAWGIYPGGQSGYPGSRYYDNAVDDWVAGKYYELLYLKTAAAADARIVGKTSLLSLK
ncbi:MAG: penicillin acylase family protein, partial [candidate division KSB1 bacterium]